MVSELSRMFSAISFGVFCRAAPSTSAIIRSTKVSPGLLVIRTTMRSDSTVVPPVTAERSPPDSRITGADSPVMADSSTLAMPSTTSPSPGITCPATTTTVSPGCRLGGRHLAAVEQVGDGRRPGLAQRGGLRLAAALGDGLGEVGEQHGQPQPGGDEPAEDARLERRPARWRTPSRPRPRRSPAGAAAPRGSSLRTAPASAGRDAGRRLRRARRGHGGGPASMAVTV